MSVKIEMKMPGSCLGYPLTYESHLCAVVHRRNNMVV